MQEELIKVAMVDDHILLRNALSSLINNTGKCKVIYEASNGKELIEKIKRETKPDVVILDLNMPEMNGHETGEAFRPVHGDAETFAHGAACPVTGDDIAATDLQHLAGGAILK